MAKNLIPEIARMLGVELNEEFKIKGYDGLTYKFVNYGLKLSFQNDIGITAIPTNVALVNLLNGNDEIVKLPWKPKKGDVYFTFGRLGDKWVVRSLWWGGFPEEYALLDKGWVYRSEKEAQAALPAVAKELDVEYKL
jgi:hypothetical protein